MWKGRVPMTVSTLLHLPVTFLHDPMIRLSILCNNNNPFFLCDEKKFRGWALVSSGITEKDTTGSGCHGTAAVRPCGIQEHHMHACVVVNLCTTTCHCHNTVPSKNYVLLRCWLFYFFKVNVMRKNPLCTFPMKKKKQKSYPFPNIIYIWIINTASQTPLLLWAKQYHSHATLDRRLGDNPFLISNFIFFIPSFFLFFLNYYNYPTNIGVYIDWRRPTMMRVVITLCSFLIFIDWHFQCFLLFFFQFRGSQDFW